MGRQQYKIDIEASPKKVWQVLFDLKTYEEWTKPFSPSSTVKSDWKKGSRAYFGDGGNSGMIAEIADRVDEKFMSIRHLGEFTDGVEDFTSDKVKEWAGSMENYTLTQNGTQTSLVIDIDVTDKWLEFFDKSWPKALEIVKQLSEQH